MTANRCLVPREDVFPCQLNIDFFFFSVKCLSCCLMSNWRLITLADSLFRGVLDVVRSRTRKDNATHISYNIVKPRNIKTCVTLKSEIQM